MIRQLTKIALAAIFATSTAGAIVVTQAQNPVEESTPASAQPYYHHGYYRGHWYWHGRYWYRRHWHPGYWGPYHRWHAGFWAYF